MSIVQSVPVKPKAFRTENDALGLEDLNVQLHRVSCAIKDLAALENGDTSVFL